MLTDSFGRAIYYLRVSVTDRCNYRCSYCMPPQGVELKRHDDMLRYEDISKIASEAGKLGFNKIRLTGGEPLVKKNIEDLVAMISYTGFFNDICMTTNGSLLTEEKAAALKKAGLHRINISLDTLDALQFAEITGGGNISDVFAGIKAARSAAIGQVKLNMVISEKTKQSDIDNMRIYCSEMGVRLQLISRFSLKNRSDITATDIVTDRPPKCSLCNRIRITADGYVKSCLFSDNEMKIDLDNIGDCLKAAVCEKPQNGISCTTRYMSQIGG